jgi:hypothetical protein
LTHARIRLAQGDRAGAVLLLEALERARPDDAEVRELLSRARAHDGAGADTPRASDRESDDGPPAGGDPSLLAARFGRALRADSSPSRNVVRRLQSWLAAIRRDSP